MADTFAESDDELRPCLVCQEVPAVVFAYRRERDGAGRFLCFSDDIARYTGHGPDDLLADESLLWSSIHPDDRRDVLDRFRAALEAVTDLMLECRIAAGLDELPTWVSIRVTPRRQADGGVTWFGLIGDATQRKQLERQIREQEQRFMNTARNVPGAVFRYVLHPDGSDEVEYMSPGCLALWEIPAEEVMHDASRLWRTIVEDDLPAMQASVRQSAETLSPWHHQWRIDTPSGCRKWLEASGQPTRLDDGSVLWDTVILDVTDRVLAEDRSRRSEQRYRLLADNTSDLVLLLDQDGRAEYASPSCRNLLGLAPEALLGTSLLDRVPAEERSLAELSWFPPGFDERPTPNVLRLRREDGALAWFEGAARRLQDQQEGPRWLLSLRDVSERVRMEQQARHDATHDALTGLPNRALLEERLRVAMDRARRGAYSGFAVIYLDLDRFKVVNDSLGHEAGNQLLCYVAGVLRGVLRSWDFASRVVGDEFVLVLEEVSGIEDVLPVVQRLRRRLAAPLEIGGQPVEASASIGIALSTPHYSRPSELLRDADIAMYRAKRNAREGYAVFDPAMQEQARDRMRLESELRSAIGTEQLVVHYQPIVDLDQRAVVAVEALVRWQHPERGLLMPGQFIGVAEETGLIESIDSCVLRRAASDLLAWRRDLGGGAPRHVSVNFSARELQREGCVERLTRLVAEFELPPSSLWLEVTESMLIDDFDRAQRVLQRLVDLGFRISLDDFGTGFSSLSYLHRLPVQALKADRSFIAAALDDAVARGILESLSALARSLDLPIVAEGVESAGQLALVRRLGYPMVQGFLISRALPVDECADVFSGIKNILNQQLK